MNVFRSMPTLVLAILLLESGCVSQTAYMSEVKRGDRLKLDSDNQASLIQALQQEVTDETGKRQALSSQMHAIQPLLPAPMISLEEIKTAPEKHVKKSYLVYGRLLKGVDVQKQFSTLVLVPQEGSSTYLFCFAQNTALSPASRKSLQSKSAKEFLLAGKLVKVTQKLSRQIQITIPATYAFQITKVLR